MKRIFTLLFLASFIGFAFSQTHLSEDFSGNQMPPADWSIDGYTAQWSVSGTTNAGGDAPEAKFTYINSVGTTRLISPSVDLSGQSSVTVKFDHYYDDYTGLVQLWGSEPDQMAVTGL